MLIVHVGFISGLTLHGGVIDSLDEGVFFTCVCSPGFTCRYGRIRLFLMCEIIRLAALRLTLLQGSRWKACFSVISVCLHPPSTRPAI